MKDKLHALIEEQKALTAKFEELVNETNYAFIGDKDRAEDIKTFLNSTLDCERRDCIYFHNIKTNLPDVYLMGSLGATHKHFEDYTIVDLKCEPDFFKKHSNSEIPNNPDPKKVYIKGHPTRGAEVIKMLEDLGGVNKFNWDGTRSWIIYRIRHEDNVILSTAIEDLRYTPCNIELHLPEEVGEVDPPKEEVELIEGGVYVMGDCIGIFKERISNNHTKWYCALESKQRLRDHEITYGQCLNAKHTTPEQKEQIYAALEKANKYFDRVNMRLLDVEEWRGKNGEAFIYMPISGIWTAAIFENQSDYAFAPYYLIPYNDQTKHLVGTTDSPNKRYKFVEK